MAQPQMTVSYPFFSNLHVSTITTPIYPRILSLSSVVINHGLGWHIGLLTLAQIVLIANHTFITSQLPCQRLPLGLPRLPSDIRQGILLILR